MNTGKIVQVIGPVVDVEFGEGNVGIELLGLAIIELPESERYARRRGQRKPGNTRGSPRRSRRGPAGEQEPALFFLFLADVDHVLRAKSKAPPIDDNPKGRIDQRIAA